MKTKKAISLVLTALMLLSLCAVGASAAVIAGPTPEWEALARQRIPQNLHITLHNIEQEENLTYVNGTATWDDDENVTECEFNPYLRFGDTLARIKSNLWTIIKNTSGSGPLMVPRRTISYDPVYKAENGVCSADFILPVLGDEEEISVEGDDSYLFANGIKFGSRLRFTVTALVELDGYYGETPEGDAVEFTFTEDALGKTFAANNGPETPAVPQNVAAIASGDRQITVSYDVSDGATQYNIYRNDEENATYRYKGTTFATAADPTKYVDKNLKAGTTYSYKVVAVTKAQGLTLVSDMSAAADARAVGAPAIPQNVAANASGAGEITVSCDACDGATQYNFYRYNSTKNAYVYKGTTFASAAEPTRYVDRNLNAGTTYYYKVVAVTKEAGLTLVSAMSASAHAKAVSADQIAAGEVVDKINAIGTVEYTEESKALIDAARDAYEALTPAQQALVTNLADLEAAEEAYLALTPGTNDPDEPENPGNPDAPVTPDKPQSDNRCKWCGGTHEGFFGGIVGFFHRVFYFFAHLFGLR